MSGTNTPGAQPVAQPGTAPDPTLGQMNANHQTPQPGAQPGTGQPWWQGAPQEDIGFLQIKGWDQKPANEAALEAVRSYRNAEKLVGAPPDELVRLPKNQADPLWQAARQRFGVPAQAADYDMTGVKFTDGEALEPAADQMLREAALEAGVPKDRLPAFAARFVKFLEGQDASDAAETAAALTVERDALAKSWGTNFELNKFTARQGALALGFTEAEIGAIEGVVGYAKVMEALRRVGAGQKEDTLGQGGLGGSAGKIVTVEMAVARKGELLRDAGWRNRYLASGVEEVREMTALNTIITEAGRPR